MTAEPAPMASEYPIGGAPVVRRDERGRLLCKAKSQRTGQLCGAFAVTGMTVCYVHGGATPQARSKAKLRLAELVDPAIATLAREMVNADSSADRQRAANSILDRAGWGRVTTIEAGDARELLIQRLLSMREAAVADGAELAVHDPEIHVIDQEPTDAP